MRFSKLFLTIGCGLGLGLMSQAQLYINGATFHIESGATVTVQGDLTSNVDISGPGKILLKGSSLQNVNMNGFTIPNLELDNVSNATLITGNTKIGTSLLLTNGRFQTGAQDLILASSATITGASTTRFIWTNGVGQLKKELTTDVVAFTLPVGENTSYRPAFLTTSGTNTGSFGVRVVSGASPNRPPMMANYINAHWPVTKTGMNGTATLSGQYVDPADVTGTEANLSGYYFNNTDWSSTGETHDAALNRVGAPIATNSGVLYGMNKYVAAGARAFLQGAYNAGTGLMSDALRAGTNIIPLSDPYRVAPYNANFSHVANPTTETAAASVFNNAASTNNDIVDWVFLQLRNTNASPGNTILQTRSALIQRDGDIVDIDGVSPVTFNNITNGNYAITVRHRNHLGLSVNPTEATAPRSLSETQSVAFTTNVVDLRTITGTKLYGTSAAFTTNSHPGLGTVNLLWGGNANGNVNTRFLGLSNDKDYILFTGLSNNGAAILNNVYNASDINMNRNVRYLGLSNDKDFLLLNILNNASSTIRNQALPN